MPATPFGAAWGFNRSLAPPHGVRWRSRQSATALDLRAAPQRDERGLCDRAGATALALGAAPQHVAATRRLADRATALDLGSASQAGGRTHRPAACKSARAVPLARADESANLPERSKAARKETRQSTSSLAFATGSQGEALQAWQTWRLTARWSAALQPSSHASSFPGSLKHSLVREVPGDAASSTGPPPRRGMYCPACQVPSRPASPRPASSIGRASDS